MVMALLLLAYGRPESVSGTALGESQIAELFLASGTDSQQKIARQLPVFR